MIGNCFYGGLVAGAAAKISGVNRNTAILFYHKLREVIFAGLDAETPELMAGKIEVGESYFNGPRKAKLMIAGNPIRRGASPN
jgi:transposase